MIATARVGRLFGRAWTPEEAAGLVGSKMAYGPGTIVSAEVVEDGVELGIELDSEDLSRLGSTLLRLPRLAGAVTMTVGQ